MSSEVDERLKALYVRGHELLTADHFAALGVAHTATRDEVHQAFVAAAKAWHPDRAPAGDPDARALFTQVFARLETARATLSDANARLLYVGELKRGARDASFSAKGASAKAAKGGRPEAAVEFKKGEVMLKKNDFKQAESHLRRAIQLAPDVVDYAALLLWLQAKPPTSPDELQRFIRELDGLVEREPGSARAHFYRAQLLKRAGRDASAKAAFERAASLDPTNIDAAREVRLYEMRQEKAQARPKEKADEAEGVGGLFRRLFKR